MNYKLKQKLTYDMVLKLKRYDQLKAEHLTLKKNLLQGYRHCKKLSRILRGMYVQN